jgi:hypothetical protein
MPDRGEGSKGRPIRDVVHVELSLKKRLTAQVVADAFA